MKYRKAFLKYLVDIIIIIIGVVIAFYLTEYGETLRERKNEKDVVKQIYFELKNNLEDLERDHLIHRTGLISHLHILNILNEQRPIEDSLVFDFYWMTRDEYIFPNASGYENLKSFGVNLVQDDSLRNLITLIYNHDFPRLAKGKTIHPDIGEYFSPFYQKNFRANRDTSLKYTLKLNDSLEVSYPREIGLGVQQIIGYQPLDRRALLQDEEFYYLVTNALEYRVYKFTFYQRCIDHVKSAISRIEDTFGKSILQTKNERSY